VYEGLVSCRTGGDVFVSLALRFRSSEQDFSGLECIESLSYDVFCCVALPDQDLDKPDEPSTVSDADNVWSTADEGLNGPVLALNPELVLKCFFVIRSPDSKEDVPNLFKRSETELAFSFAFDSDKFSNFEIKIDTGLEDREPAGLDGLEPELPPE